MPGLAARINRLREEIAGLHTVQEARVESIVTPLQEANDHLAFLEFFGAWGPPEEPRPPALWPPSRKGRFPEYTKLLDELFPERMAAWRRGERWGPRPDERKLSAVVADLLIKLVSYKGELERCHVMAELYRRHERTIADLKARILELEAEEEAEEEESEQEEPDEE